MTALLRCRGSLREIAAIFDAEPEPTPEWRPEIWPGERCLAVRVHDGRRVIEPMTWGLPSAAFADGRTIAARRATLFPRELRRDAHVLDEPDRLERCLIVLEAFAYPIGEERRRTRCWAGLWDHPLTAWAAVCTGESAEDGGCAGLLGFANPLMEPVSRHMPLLVDPAGFAGWLDGSDTLMSLPIQSEPELFYLERTDERWSTGESIDDEH